MQVEAFPCPGPGMQRYVAWQNALATREEHALAIFVEAPQSAAGEWGSGRGKTGYAGDADRPAKWYFALKAALLSLTQFYELPLALFVSRRGVLALAVGAGNRGRGGKLLDTVSALGQAGVKRFDMPASQLRPRPKRATARSHSGIDNAALRK